VLAGNIKCFADLDTFDELLSVSNSAGLDECEISPVWSRRSGGAGSALILSRAIFSVPVTSWLAALLKPMWLSLICTKLKAEPDFEWSVPPLPLVAAKSLDVGTPPAMVQSSPVPAQAIQLRKFRRSIPSPAAGLDEVDSAGSADSSCGLVGMGLFASFIEILQL